MAKVIYNDLIPFKGFKAMALLPFIFARNRMDGRLLSVEDINHEDIHIEQQKEMLCVGMLLAGVIAMITMSWWSLAAIPVFFYWYGIEWFIRLFMKGDAYRNISFEREAYGNEKDLLYLKKRNAFAWVKYLKK